MATALPVVDLERFETGDQGTFALATLPGGSQLYFGELPWRGNQTGVSCIPGGTYKCVWANSPKHGYCYYVQDVPGRMDVEIHSANWMGDKALGWYSQLEGCLAPGRSVQEVAPAAGLRAQRAVTSSRDALAYLEAQLEQQPFLLRVRWRPGTGPVGTPTGPVTPAAPSA